MKIEVKVEGASKQQMENYTEILTALLSVGGLDGVKNGKTVINFDHEGVFQNIQLDYIPWRRRKKE